MPLPLNLPPPATCQLYRVVVAAPVLREVYHVLAESFEAAAALVIEAETGTGGLVCGGVKSIAVVAAFVDGDLLRSKKIAKPLGLIDPSTL